MIGDQQRFAENCLTITMGNLGKEVDRRIRDQRFHLFQILAELLNSFLPELFISLLVRLRPITLRPLRRNVLSVSTELQNVPLRNAHVLKHLPGGVWQARDPLAALISRE